MVYVEVFGWIAFVKRCALHGVPKHTSEDAVIVVGAIIILEEQQAQRGLTTAKEWCAIAKKWFGK